MEFKEYQKKTLEQVKQYLEALAEFKAKNEKAQYELGVSIDFLSIGQEIFTKQFSKNNGDA